MKHLAGSIQIAPNGGFTGFGPLGTNQGDYSILTFANFLSTIIGVMTFIAVIWFVFTFIIGAIGIISSGGDKGALEAAKKKITNALIGLVVVILATVIINLIGYLLGIPEILQIQTLFYRLIY